MIFDYVRPEDIAYISLGSFRCMPDLLKVIEQRHSQAGYIYNEFIPGLDGKMRLLRPLRVEQFSWIARTFLKFGVQEQLYFCMESDEVWNKVLGTTPKALGGLDTYLTQRAFMNKG